MLYVSQGEVAGLVEWPRCSFRACLAKCLPGPTGRRHSRRLYYEVESLIAFFERVSPEGFDDDAELRIRKAATNPFTQGIDKNE